MAEVELHVAAYVEGAVSLVLETLLRVRFEQHQGSAHPAVASAAEVNRLAHNPGEENNFINNVIFSLIISVNIICHCHFLSANLGDADMCGKCVIEANEINYSLKIYNFAYSANE